MTATNPTNVVSLVLATCTKIDELEDQLPFGRRRNRYSVLCKIVEEVGEMATELNIDCGHLLKEPGPDGVIGESVDAIISLIDMIYCTDDTMTEEALAAIFEAKLGKWVAAKKSFAEKHNLP